MSGARDNIPGEKQREYPHSSGDRNTFPLRRHRDKGVSGGGTQKVAPTDSATAPAAGEAAGRVGPAPGRRGPRPQE